MKKTPSCFSQRYLTVVFCTTLNDANYLVPVLYVLRSSSIHYFVLSQQQSWQNCIFDNKNTSFPVSCQFLNMIWTGSHIWVYGSAPNFPWSVFGFLWVFLFSCFLFYSWRCSLISTYDYVYPRDILRLCLKKNEFMKTGKKRNQSTKQYIVNYRMSNTKPVKTRLYFRCSGRVRRL